MSNCVPGTKIEKPYCRLVGENGNAFAVMGAVSGALRDAGVPAEIIQTYRKEAMSGDYDNLLRVSLDYVEHDDEDEDE